ncbi:MAG: hypothetical protein AAFX06_31610 [Planctomycetota bacterium]
MHYTKIVVLIFVLSAHAGCSRSTPGDDWQHLRTGSWKYSLKHRTRVADYSFSPNGRMTVSYGTKSDEGSYSVVKVVPFGTEWSVKNGVLSFGMGGVAGIDRQQYKIVSLSDSTASVVDINTGKKLVFERSQTQTN